MKSRFLKVSVILVMILTMTMSNFVLVGNYFVSYAVDSITTNHKNVEFEAYMKDDTTLSLQVSVKNEGYFNGKITLEEGNFLLKKSESEYVNKMENNIITLNQINSGTTAQVDVTIEPVKEEIYDAGLLTMESKLSLSGIYKDSSEKDKEISATRMIHYQMPENNTEENIENKNEIITNKIVTVNEEEKRVIQIAMNRGLKENNYPIAKIETNIVVPTVNEKNPKVEVNTNFNTMTSYDWKQENNKIALNLSNNPNDENKILWKNSGTENTIITLIYDKEVELKDSEIKIDDKIILYNNKELVSSSALTISEEEKDSIVQVFSENTESAIYKGKLYAGMDREYESKATIRANLAEAIDKIRVQENASKFQGDNSEVEANVYYQSTKINKSKMLDILGEEGSITITNSSLGVIGTITKDTPDTNGEVTIPYQEGIEDIVIETSTPQKSGILELTNKKVIKPVNIENIKNSTNLVTKVTASYKEDVIAESIATMELKEPTTEATIQLNKANLSTAVTNENVEMKVTLKSVSERNDLYKNPMIQIELPEEVQEVAINSINKSYDANEFVIADYQVITTETGKKAIQIKLQGEQKNYINNPAEGIQVIVNANITLKKEMASKESEIKMIYTNENGAEETYETKTAVSIYSREGTLLYSSLNNYNAEGNALETTNNETLTGKMDVQGASKVAKVERTIINNNEQNMEEVVIIGTIDAKSTVEATISNVILSGIDAKVYYSTAVNATVDSDTWKEDSAGAKSYKIILEPNTIEIGKVLKVSYELNIPENLEFDKQLYENTTISYVLENQTLTKSASLYLATPSGESQEAIDIYTKTEEVAEIGNAKVVAFSGGKVIGDKTEVHEGQTIKYQITIANTSEKDREDLKVEVKHKNAYLMDKVANQMPDSFNEEQITTSYYLEEVEGLTNKTFTIQELKAGETTVIEYQAVVNENVEITEAQINVAAQQVATFSNKVIEGDLKLNLIYGLPVDYSIQPKTIVTPLLSVKNISDDTQKDIVVEFEVPTELKIENVNEDDDFEILENNENYLKCKISSISKGAIKYIPVSLKLANSNPTEDMSVNMHYSAILGNSVYISNDVTAVNKVNENRKTSLELTQTANIDSGATIKAGDEITYTFTIENKNDKTVEIEKFEDNLPEALEVEKAYYTLGENNIDIEMSDENMVQISDIKIEADSKIYVTIIGKINEDKIPANTIKNYATVMAKEETEVQSNEITYALEEASEPQEPENPGNPGNSEEPGNSEQPNEPDEPVINDEARVISGAVWIDENKNGTKEISEERLPNITVKLINVDTEKQQETKTNEYGAYQFENLEKGKYMVAFEYDTTKYSVTEYRKSGINDNVNSDVITNTITIGGETKTVGLTDIIEIKDNRVSNIDAGLIENSVFDLSLKKYVSRVIIQNKAGTKTTEYTDTQLAKIELDAKQIANTTVVVEYTIAITNEGELPGYASEIVDYKPNDLTFSSELNKDWYTTTDGNLHNKTLADNRIEPGETKSVTLTLTKAMTENNTGRTANTAEIAKSTNDMLISDIDSIAGNKAENEDDISRAEVIISIRTGLAITIGSIVAIILLGLIICVILYKRRKEV